MEEPPPDPNIGVYPRPRAIWVAVGVMTVVVTIVLVILNIGGSEDARETQGDLTYLAGTRPKEMRGEAELAASIADLISADLTAEDPGTLVLSAEVASSAPRSLERSALEFRWELTGGDGSVWTLTVSIDSDAQVALFSDRGYGSGTIDATFPGEVVIEDDAVSVRLETGNIEDFPSAFDWKLATTLRAFRDEPDSPRVEDRFPDSGALHITN